MLGICSFLLFLFSPLFFKKYKYEERKCVSGSASEMKMFLIQHLSRPQELENSSCVFAGIKYWCEYLYVHLDKDYFRDEGSVLFYFMFMFFPSSCRTKRTESCLYPPNLASRTVSIFLSYISLNWTVKNFTRFLMPALLCLMLYSTALNFLKFSTQSN